jgi:3',5'-cyclic AMP phosphodiesterase CpdA
LKIIHITDFHLAAPGKRLFGLDTHDRVERCLADIARWHGDAEFCVMTGDLTNDGDRQAYAWLAERLEDFPLKTFLMVGNHDEREGFTKVFPGQERDENGFVQSAHKTDQGVFLFLDTLKGPVSEGEYCAARRDWLAQQLNAAASDPVWIFMHHPPFDVGVAYMDRIKLEEPEAFAEVLSHHGDIRHIFFGHVHRAAFVHWRGIPCTSLPGTSMQIPLNPQSVGTRLSVEAAMYGIVLIEEGQTTVLFDACLDRAPADMG